MVRRVSGGVIYESKDLEARQQPKDYAFEPHERQTVTLGQLFWRALAEIVLTLVIGAIICGGILLLGVAVFS